MDASHEEWIAEYRRLQADLWVFDEQIKQKQGPRGEWTSPPSPEEEVFDELTYFHSAALLNNADVASYVPFMIEKRKSLEAIGAVGCLAALDQLLPLYRQQQSLPSDREREDYWMSKQIEHEKAHALAEDPNEFACLLLAYAIQNSDKFGGVQPSAESRARHEEAIQSALKSLGIPLP